MKLIFFAAPLFAAAAIAAAVAGAGAVPAETPFAISAEMASSNGWILTRPPSGCSARWYADRYGVVVKEFQIQRIDWASGKAIVQFLRPATPSDEARLWSGLEKDGTPDVSLAKKNGTILLVIAEDSADGARIRRAILPDAATASADAYRWIAGEIPADVAGLRAAARRFDPDVASQEFRAGGMSLVAVYQANFDFSRARSLAMRPAQVAFWVPRRLSDLPELVRRLGRFPLVNLRVLTGKRGVAVVSGATEEARDLLAAAMGKKGYLAASAPPEPPPATP